MSMHAANPESSARLQRVLECLRDESEWSTRDIIRQADVCAVSACVAELRQAGAVIHCRVVTQRGDDGANRRVFLYRMTCAPRHAGRGGQNR